VLRFNRIIADLAASWPLGQPRVTRLMQGAFGETPRQVHMVYSRGFCLGLMVAIGRLSEMPSAVDCTWDPWRSLDLSTSRTGCETSHWQPDHGLLDNHKYVGI
jgi:hypothetical protein